ncbi:MAG: hypothetical protein AAFR42_08095 [Cyanobacteria bacterium J06628_6]
MAAIAIDQLTQAAATLAEQEAALNAQLATIQEQRQGIQTVIAMFSDTDSDVAPATDAEESEEPEIDVSPAEEASSVAATPDDDTPEEEEAPVAKAPKPKRRGRPKKSVAKSSTKTKLSKRGGRSAEWQTYIRDEYSDVPLPDVVAKILKTSPKKVFKIAAVMEALFPADEMPKADFLKARNRVSNILSAGARSGDWHRGRGGTYSCTKKTVA